MGRRLYVGNLPYTTGEGELQELFSKAGTVESVRVMRDAATGRARGFAFVEMATDEEAQRAATEFNQYQLGGRSLTVNEARPKPEGGFGGGGGYGGEAGAKTRDQEKGQLSQQSTVNSPQSAVDSSFAYRLGSGLSTLDSRLSVLLFPNIDNSVGTNTSVTTVETDRPPITAIASGFRSSAPAPNPSASGSS